ncbi:MAG TPA: TetR/AcrR family transcriptional regulator [Actinomycetota bacterium]|nr:TetR/AcrR family transcriptional regulator [Actinomycetota bacterium]
MKATAPKRARAKRGEGEKLRAQILEAANELLIETGDQEAVSIRAVADRVGVTPPSIYMHFADKNDLIFAVCEGHFNALDEAVQEAAAGIDDPLLSLHRRGRAYIQFGLDNPEQYRILFMSKPAAAPHGFQEERLKGSASFDHLVEAVQQVIDAGVFEGEATQISICLWVAVHGITSLLLSHPNFPWPDIDATIDSVLQMALRGLVSKPA